MSSLPATTADGDTESTLIGPMMLEQAQKFAAERDAAESQMCLDCDAVPAASNCNRCYDCQDSHEDRISQRRLEGIGPRSEYEIAMSAYSLKEGMFR